MESVTQAICDLALRFGEGVEGQKAIMVARAHPHTWLHVRAEPALWGGPTGGWRGRAGCSVVRRARAHTHTHTDAARAMARG